MRKLALSSVAGEYAICQAEANAPIEAALLSGAFCSMTRTNEELSIVCGADKIPAGMRADRGWRVLKIEGLFAFSEVGVLRSALSPLADAGISIFAISTFNTDYVLLRAEDLAPAAEALERHGHSVRL